MNNTQVNVHLNDWSPAGTGELEIHHADSMLTFRNDLWVSDGAHKIGEILFTRYTKDSQTIYVKTQEVGRILKHTTDQREQTWE